MPPFNGQIYPSPVGYEGPMGPTGPAGPQGISTSLFNYRANTLATSGYPGDGYILWDDETQADSTAIYISHLNWDGIDIDLFLSLLDTTETITLQDSASSSNYQEWQISGAPTNVDSGSSGSYWQLPVTLVSSSGTGTSNFSNDDNILLATINGIQGATGPSGVMGATGAIGQTGATGPGSVVSDTLSYTTSSLASGDSEDFTISMGSSACLLSVTSSTLSWVRFYGTSSARTADTRTSPGGTAPSSGSEFYAEVATTSSPQTIRFSPVPIIQTSAGNAFIRVKNTDSVTRTITLNFKILVLET